MNSQNENIKIVQQLYASFTKKNINDILALLSLDVEWGEPENPYDPAGGTRYGYAGFLEWLGIGKQNEDILILEPRKMLTDSDTVAVLGYIKCLAIPTGKIYNQILSIL
jgi:ketosteroid isomerase-like protein